MARTSQHVKLFFCFVLKPFCQPVFQGLGDLGYPNKVNPIWSGYLSKGMCEGLTEQLGMTAIRGQ